MSHITEQVLTAGLRLLVVVKTSNSVHLLTCLATSLMKVTPSLKLGKTMDPYFLTSGTGLIQMVTSVMTPRMPSDPNMKC